MSQHHLTRARTARWTVWALVTGLIAAACDQQTPTAASPSADLSPSDAGSLDLASRVAGTPLGLLSGSDRRQFFRGAVVFQHVFTPATGLGPLFNAASCAACHNRPVVGGSGTPVETHQTAFHAGSCDDLEAIGGQVIQDSATRALQIALGITKEPLLPEATGTGHRTTPSVMGLGLLEAVADSTILSHADPGDQDGDGVAGRAAIGADGHVARFGRKAVAVTIADFIGDAFIYEMGITNPHDEEEQTVRGNPLPAGVDPAPDPELSQEDFDATDKFMQLLAPPPAMPLSFVSQRGRVLFNTVGCASCHLPSLRTGASPLPALSHRVVHAYSDLLLHDMGPALADICLGQATPSEFRTEPLMGLRFKANYLHDGRAGTIAQAISLHAGEASRARDRFAALAPRERDALVLFLRSL